MNKTHTPYDGDDELTHNIFYTTYAFSPAIESPESFIHLDHQVDGSFYLTKATIAHCPSRELVGLKPSRRTFSPIKCWLLGLWTQPDVNSSQSTIQILSTAIGIIGDDLINLGGSP